MIGWLVLKEGLTVEFNTTFSKWIKSIGGDTDGQRERAFAKFSEASKINFDEWKYTNLNNLDIANYTEHSEKVDDNSKIDAIRLMLQPFAANNRLVFINGFYNQDLSKVANLKNGAAIITRFDEEYNKQDNYLDGLLGLNRAFCIEGSKLVFTESNSTLLLVNVTYTNDNNLVNCPINKIEVKDGINAELIEINISMGDKPSILNSRTDIELLDNSSLTHYVLSKGHNDGSCIRTVEVKQHANTSLTANVAELVTANTRVNYAVDLLGAGADFQCNNLQQGRKAKKHDVMVNINHNAKGCTSNTVSRGIFANNSKGYFTGKIFVSENAPGTCADLENKNLLLDATAEANTRPQLEIYQDDVSCSHGATVGQLESELVFYLSSRGIDEDTAKNLLLKSFVSPVVDKFNNTDVKEFMLESESLVV